MKSASIRRFVDFNFRRSISPADVDSCFDARPVAHSELMEQRVDGGAHVANESEFNKKKNKHIKRFTNRTITTVRSVFVGRFFTTRYHRNGKGKIRIE